MKKIVLTIAALLVAAVMVFSFVGCTKDPVDEENSTNDTVAEQTEEDTAANADVEAETVSAA